VKLVSILIPHFKTWRWTSACIHLFKHYGFSLPYEIIVCDNSPGHPSIKCLTETELGEGVTIVEGQADFPSHGKGYFKAYQKAQGDWIFTAESDSFPTRHGWGEGYIKAAEHHDFIAPLMPMAAGAYGHPAGALVKRNVLDAHQEWRNAQKEWLFVPDGARAFKYSDEGYHLVVKEDTLCLKDWPPGHDSLLKSIELWRDDVGPWQEMRSFDDDNFKTYGQRTGIQNWQPAGKNHHLRIGYEPGQHLWYFAKSHGVKCMEAPLHIEWMPGRTGQQASYSDVFGGFRHVWAGTSAFCDGIPAHTKEHKMQQMNQHFAQLPEHIRTKVEELERKHA
jgi:hypothetical protein